MTDSIYPAHFPYEPRFLDVGGHRLAYLDEGSGETTILMVHGNPVSGFVYFRLLQQLLPHYRCLVPDLLGFGLSDKPAAETAYSLTKHIDLMTAFVQTLNVQKVVLVVHDWGGPIGWGAALRERARYSHLVILNTLTEAPMTIRPLYRLPFHLFRRTPRLFRLFAREKNMFQKMGVSVMAEADQAVYFRANNTPEKRAGIASFPRMIPYNESHPNTKVLREILQGVTAWSLPSLVLFSDHDSVFSAEQGARFARRLPQARFKLIAGPKHFLQYQAPAEVAAEIVGFL